MLDANAHQIQGREGTVATTGNVTVRLFEAGAEDTGAAAHCCDFGVRVTRLVILEIERRIDEGEVREEALAGDFHGAFE